MQLNVVIHLFRRSERSSGIMINRINSNDWPITFIKIMGKPKYCCVTYYSHQVIIPSEKNEVKDDPRNLFLRDITKGKRIVLHR